MVLLVLAFKALNCSLSIHLHSTMVLLVPTPLKHNQDLEYQFTFHYGSISTCYIR